MFDSRFITTVLQNGYADNTYYLNQDQAKDNYMIDVIQGSINLSDDLVIRDQILLARLQSQSVLNGNGVSFSNTTEMEGTFLNVEASKLNMSNI